MFNEYPYRNIEDLNLDYLQARVRNLEKIVEQFVALESVTFADPIDWRITKQYAKNVIVLDENGTAFISKKPVPTGVYLNNDEYWLEIFNFMDYVKSFNSNLTFNIESNTDRASVPYSVGDWLLLDDVLYKVLFAIPADGLFEIGVNIEHFTVEDFIKAWINYANGLIVQYKNDIDASELEYKNEIQAEIDRIIAGVTVDSEVIDARLGGNGKNYTTLGEATRGQYEMLAEVIKECTGAEIVPITNFGERVVIDSSLYDPTDTHTVNALTYPNAYFTEVSCTAGDVFTINAIGLYSATFAFVDSSNNILMRSDDGDDVNNYVVTAPPNSAKLIINSRDGEYSFIGVPSYIKDLGQNFINQLVYNIDSVIPADIDGFIRTDQATVNPQISNNYSTYRYTIIPCSNGDKFTLFGTSTYDRARLFCFIDSSGTIIERADGNIDYQNRPVYLTTPASSEFLIFNTESNGFIFKGHFEYDESNNFTQSFENVIIQTGSKPPYKTTSINTYITLSKYSRIHKHDLIKVTGVTSPLQYRIFMFYGEWGDAITREYALDGNAYTSNDATFVAKEDGYFMIQVRYSDSSPITPADFTGTIEIIKPKPTKLRVLSYNTGDYTGTGLVRGSNDAQLAYRRAIAKTSSDLLLIQSDTFYVDDGNSITVKNGIFKNIPYFYDQYGTGLTHYLMFGGKYPINNIQKYIYTTPGVGHKNFIYGLININGIDILVVSLHLDWSDITLRLSQVAEVIAFCDNYEYVIIGGDFNPSSRVNGDFPPGHSHYQNYYDSSTYDAFTSAGYNIGNAGYLGFYQTDMGYSDADDSGASAVWDNVITSGNISIVNASNSIETYMNDHAIFYVDIEFS